MLLDSTAQLTQSTLKSILDKLSKNLLNYETLINAHDFDKMIQLYAPDVIVIKDEEVLVHGREGTFLKYL